MCVIHIPDGEAAAMKLFGVYWLIGCLVLAYAVVTMQERCPGQRMTMSSDVTLTFLAIWPVPVFIGLFWGKRWVKLLPETACAAGAEQ